MDILQVTVTHFGFTKSKVALLISETELLLVDMSSRDVTRVLLDHRVLGMATHTRCVTGYENSINVIHDLHFHYSLLSCRLVPCTTCL